MTSTLEIQSLRGRTLRTALEPPHVMFCTVLWAICDILVHVSITGTESGPNAKRGTERPVPGSNLLLEFYHIDLVPPGRGKRDPRRIHRRKLTYQLEQTMNVMKRASIEVYSAPLSLEAGGTHVDGPSCCSPRIASHVFAKP